MSMSTKKLLSIVLCICMLVGLCQFNLAISAADTTPKSAVPTEYYVKFGGSGDGRSENAPAGSIPAVISAINTDGHTTGDLVTVYVIDSGEGSLDVINSNVLLGYDPQGLGSTPEHSATIKWTSYDPDTVTSIIGHTGYLSWNSYSTHLVVKGPSIFEDINIVDMRFANAGGTDIYLNHYPVEFRNVKFGDLDTSCNVFYPSATHFAMGMIRGNKNVERDQYVYLDNADIIGDYVNVLGYTDSGASQSVKGNVTLEIGAGTLKNLNISGSNAGATETVDGNLSIVLGEGVTVTNIGTGSVPVVTGAFTLVQNYGATIPTYTATPWSDTSKTAKAPYYNIIAASEDIAIDVTDTAGTFEITKGIAYTVSDDNKTINYYDGIATLDAGVHTLEGAESLDEIKAAVVPEAPEGFEFKGWDDSVDGVLTAIIEEVVVESEHKYYVKVGGSGDGRSENAPAGSIPAIITNINNDGHTTGDKVVVYVIDSGEGSLDVINSNVLLGYDPQGFNATPEHKATIKWTSYDPDTVTSIIGHTGYLSWNSNSAHLQIKGPSIFENINIVDMRFSSNGGTDIYLNHYPVEFRNVKFGDLDTSCNVFYPSSTHFAMGMIRGRTIVGRDQYVYLDNADVIGEYVNVMGYNDDITVQGTTGNVTLKIGSGTLKNLYITGSNAAATESVGKNLNIILGENVTVSKVGNASVPVVQGAIQIVQNYGATLPESAVIKGYTSTAKDKETPVYRVIASSADISLDITDTAGTFAADAGDAIAYAVSEDSTTIYYSISGKLAVGKGKYTIYAAEDIEEAMASVTPPASDIYGNAFTKWIDDGNGKITAQYGDGETEAPTVFYAQFGATGNGIFENDPAGDLAALVKTINSLYGKGDEVTVKVIPHANQPTDGKWDSAEDSVFLPLNSVPAHDATIRFTSIDENEKSYVTFTNHFAATWPAGTHLSINGPTIFDNINIIDNRGDNYTWDINCNYHSVEFKDTDIYYIPKSKGHVFTPWFGHFYVGGNRSAGTFSNIDSTIKLDAKATGYIGDLGISGYADGNQTTRTANGNITLEIEGGSLPVIYIDKNKSGFPQTFMGDVNIILNGTTVEQFSNANTPIISGTLSVIRNNGATLPASPAISCPTYDITSGDGVKVSLTGEKGVFAVECDGIAYVQSADGRKIYYGKETLDLAPGAYTVYTAEDIDAIIENANDPIIPDAYKHSGWDASVDGVLSAIIEYEGNGEPAYFVMNGGTGDGLSPNSPVGSVAEVINVINAAGYDADDEVTVFIMDACEEPYKYDKFGNSVLGVSFYNKDVYTRATTWRNGYGDTSRWQCHLNFKAYDYELTGKNTHLMWMPVYGQDTNLTFHGDATFNNINFINTRLWDREFFVNGYDVCFNDCVFYNLKTDKHSNQGAYKGEVVSNHPKFMLSGAEGLGGVLNINSPFDTEGKYGVHFAGSGSAAYTNHVTVNLADPDINTGIYWGSNISSFADGLSLFMNGGTVREMDATGGSVTIGNGFEIVANADNTIFDMSLPENVAISGGIWNIKVNGDEMFLAPSGKTGTYLVTGDNIVAKATNEETGAVYFSYESTLTLPVGTYTVDSFLESELEDVKVDIYFDNDHASGAHYVGYVVHLPVLEDRVEEFFAGWDLETIDGNTTRYNGGETFEIPEGESELYFYSAWEPYEDTVVIYLDQENGDDENEGSLFDPVKSIDKAFALAEASECATKKVAVVGRYGFGDQESFPKHTSHIILSGDDSGEAVFDINDDCARVNGPLTIENIKLDQSTASGGKAMCASINELIFGKGLTVDSKFRLRLGDFRSHEGPVKASFFSGNFPHVEVGHFWGYTRGTVDSAEILVDGANIATLSFNSNGWLDTQMGVDYTGPVSITINSGSVGSVIATTSAEDSTKYAEFKDTFTMVLNNGCTTKFDDGISAANGVYVLTVEQEEGSYLEITDVPGKFKVVGAKTAVATNKENGAQFASEDGFITVSAGQYNVEFTDKLYYTNSGEKIRIYNECTLDLATIHHNEPAGKLFLGWTYEDGTTCGATFDGKPGDVLVARYVDYSASRDFSIIGAQIRTQGVQGLRFVVEKKNDFFNALPDVSEFGTIVLPTDATWGRDMFIDQPQVAEWKWDSETRLVFTPKSNNGYTPAKVVGEKIFKETDDSVQYTLCITNITEDKYYRFYSVKGYIVYKDYNGLEQVLYTDYYQTNLYRIALAALKAGEASAETFEGIKEYVEVDRKAAYMAENYDTRQLLTGYPTTEDKDPNHAMYRLANGMKIREVEVDTGIGGDEIEIVHFADTHLNYINRMDMEIGETNTLSTYRGRSWLRDGSSVPNINRAMEYASFFDKTVITGDIMDYFSWGCAEVMTKTIIDRSNKVVMALGNHEPAELCQPDMNDLSYKYSLDHTYQVLQSIWKTNDIYYHSEILTNDEGTEKVMIVLLDNQRDAYWGDIQAVPFAADIEKAREKGIPILIFEHNPISTQNPNETAATWFFEPGDLSGIPCDMTKSFAGSPAHGYADTMKVYNLIVRNSDVIKGVFCGHWHNHMYTEILAQNEDGSFKTDENGNYVVIPQHTVTANAYGSGNAIKITIK